MSDGRTSPFGTVGAMAAALAVLMPVILAQGKSLRRALDHVLVHGGRLDSGDDRLADNLRLRSDRVARIEGSFTAPRRASAPSARKARQ